MSIDKACGILAFFTGLELSKSQADSLLSQLAADWQIEYDAIAELVAAAAILYIDETGWRVGKRSCYTWIFSTLSTVLFKCGVGRGKAVLTEVLGEQFDGIGVTDDYGVYHSQFTEHQLCWAHFVFVLHPEVEATNNRSERQARSEAMARKAARTSKTESGAKRRGVIMSVLASLSRRLEHFTLGSVLSEINHWFETGQSVFREELDSLQAATTALSNAPP